MLAAVVSTGIFLLFLSCFLDVFVAVSKVFDDNVQCSSSRPGNIPAYLLFSDLPPPTICVRNASKPNLSLCISLHVMVVVSAPFRDHDIAAPRAKISTCVARARQPIYTTQRMCSRKCMFVPQLLV